MDIKIKSALISVFYKDGLLELSKYLQQLGVHIYSTGGTQKVLEDGGIQVTAVESVTGYPSILGGRVKTLHPSVFGGILGRRDLETDVQEMADFNIPEIDLVIVDLYPFEETVASTTDEKMIIEKIDIGGPSMLRAAAKNHQYVTVISGKQQYSQLQEMLKNQDGNITLAQRRSFAIQAFDTCTQYDVAISAYFHQLSLHIPLGQPQAHLRYGENPHQSATFFGDVKQNFTQLHGKELSYNNLVDTDAALQLIRDFGNRHPNELYTFAIIKHTNVCGVGQRETLTQSWNAALAGDPESAFGGVLVCNGDVDAETASSIQEIFFEVLLAPSFSQDALNILMQKKNRVLLQWQPFAAAPTTMYRSLLNGILIQNTDEGNFSNWDEKGGRSTTAEEKEDLIFANIIVKHLKSNAIALVKNKQLIGKGCGQTSRIDSLRQSIDKAKQFHFSLQSAVLASDAFFPFDDCVKMAHEEGIQAFIQPGGSIRDKDSIAYCEQNSLALVITGTRHFKH